jgi:dienelactone hydrolase
MLHRLWLILLLAVPATADITWHSPATGGDVAGRVIAPAKTDGLLPTVVYLTNLSIPRVGREKDETILADLTAGGHLVLVLDYAKHVHAISPKLNADVLAIREAVVKKTLLGNQKVDPNRLYILAEGFRLKRDIAFARDGDRVLAMDLFYPADPAKPVPVLVEITCDNVNRMGADSLIFCRDTLLEGAQFAGFAAAMLDHPVRPPYKGLDDPMPESLDRCKAAVAKLRDMGYAKVGAIGFSRGGPFAAMLAAGSTVDAALVHGNRYDYLHLTPDDPMLPRFVKAWGDPKTNADRWAIHGAVPMVNPNSAPMYLNTSDTESPEYRHGLTLLANAVFDRGSIKSISQIDNDGRGHRVTEDPETLSNIYRFFHANLDQ